MTDKYRKQDAALPSLTDLLGERAKGSDVIDALDDAKESSERVTIPPAGGGEATRASEDAVETPVPTAPRGGGGGVDRSSHQPDAPEGGDGREAFEPNWYRVLAAQAKVRESDVPEPAEGSEAASKNGNGSRNGGEPGYPGR